jgi:hypothetical protein
LLTYYNKSNDNNLLRIVIITLLVPIKALDLLLKAGYSLLISYKNSETRLEIPASNNKERRHT